MTDADLREVSRRVDTLVIGARSLPELYRKMNTLRKNGSPNWQTIRHPTWVGETLIAVVWKPDTAYTKDIGDLKLVDAEPKRPCDRCGNCYPHGEVLSVCRDCLYREIEVE